MSFDLLKKAAEAYYNDIPIMTDAEYDKLYDQLKLEDPTNDFFKQVGSSIQSSQWKKAVHAIPMGSLNKVQNHEQYAAWQEKRNDIDAFCISDKMDGVSCLDGDTEVYLANGERIPIKQIVDQNLRPQVLSWDKDRGLITEKVIATHDNGAKNNWVKITLEDGSVVLSTEDHLFYTEEEGWVEAKDILGKDIKSF